MQQIKDHTKKIAFAFANCWFNQRIEFTIKDDTDLSLETNQEHRERVPFVQKRMANLMYMQ
jgi:hypothetical protein